MSELFSLLDVTLLNSTLRFVAPILLAALGGMLCQRAGIFNIALEGLMLVGAFGAVVGSHLTGNALGGVATAMLAGALMALVMAVFVVSLKGDYPGLHLADKVYFEDVRDMQRVLEIAITENIDGIIPMFAIRLHAKGCSRNEILKVNFVKS